jgi:hypothetical protein
VFSIWKLNYDVFGYGFVWISPLWSFLKEYLGLFLLTNGGCLVTISASASTILPHLLSSLLLGHDD